METLDAIRKRRSIRKFKNEKIPKETISKLLEAAMYSPSARDSQPWHFIIIDQTEILHFIPKIHPHANMVYDAPLAILICSDLGLEPIVEYAAVNCSAAAENLMLAATDLGLGSVWLGVYPRKERMEPLIKLFEIPQNIVPIALIPLGYPDETIAAPERFRQERIHHNTWRNKSKEFSPYNIKPPEANNEKDEN